MSQITSSPKRKTSNTFIAYYLGATFVYADVPEEKAHYALETPKKWKMYLHYRKSVPHIVRTFRTIEELRKELFEMGCVL